MNPDARRLDTWAGLSHKAPFASWVTPDPNAPGAPRWVPRDEERRLTAYLLLDAYRRNVARWFVAGTADERDRRREYGDADVLARQVSAAIIGRGARITVAGADKRPTDPPEGATPEEAARFARVAGDYEHLVDLQARLDEWAETERWEITVRAAEQDAVALGDTVYWLTWSATAGRVRLRRLDPAAYFPVYPPGEGAEDYPQRVHLAWEWEEPDPQHHGNVTRWVRRITYQLVDLDQPRAVAYQDRPVRTTCLMTDATWPLDALRASSRDFDETRALYAVNDQGVPINALDLGVDFIPVVHVPNTPGDPWGQSLFTSVAHLLDDLQIGDTAAADASDVAGGPPIAISGAATDGMKLYGPRTLWTLPSGGAATVLDTSKGLASLADQVDRLIKRLEVNARVPGEILGRVDSGSEVSGVRFALSFGPFQELVNEARGVRRGKYGLLLKMVQRLHVAAGVWPGPVRPARVAFGAALPTDVPGLVETLRVLTGGRQLMSRETAMGALADAGVPVGEIPEELRRVDLEDWEAANLLYRATRDPGLVAQFLGVELTEFAAAVLARDKQDADTNAAQENARATLASSERTRGDGTGTGPVNPDAPPAR